MSTPLPDTDRYRVNPGSSFHLQDRDPADDSDAPNKKETRKLLKVNCDRIAELQERLYADNRRSVLLVLQAMDTGGKDSTLRAVTRGVNPQGVRIYGFKKPSSRELSRDFLWRVHREVPPRGHIGVFNRSHYEDVLVVRVRELAPPDLIEKRYGHINEFERMLTDHGTVIVKVMLHISKEYQLERLRRRLERPDKHWKFNPGDLAERSVWDDYMAAYDLALARCSTDYAPWYVIPAQNRAWRNVLVSTLLVQALETIGPQFPAPDFDPSEFRPETLI